jgi:pimeloyl-ACP methyl ester carboxylesterase
MNVRLVLRVAKSESGNLTAKLDSIDQGATNLIIDTISQIGNSLRFEARALGVSYEGTLNENATEIVGQLKQGPGTLPLVFKRTDSATSLSRPQDPQKPYPYIEEEVTYENKKDGVRLAGALTLPRGTGLHPAVLLITGSGPQDRNETVAGHRPFLVLADHLTRSGIAVLRVDDRGVGGSSAGAPTATSENYAGDVMAGIEYLKSRKEINAGQIGLIGHSEGGMIAPMVAVRSKDVAFIVLMAGLGQTGEDVIYTQTQLIQKAGGASSDTIAQTVLALKRAFTILKAEADNTIAERRIREALASQIVGMNAEQRKAFAPLEETIKAQLPMYLLPWFRYFIVYDPAGTLSQVKIPVLAINGELDLQASAKENLALIDSALRKGGNKDYSIVALPKLNHLFQTSQTGTVAEYERNEETIAPIALNMISDWILLRTTIVR